MIGLRKKVIVKLNGGLGNQLFQYAAARAMADRLELNLLLDISAFKADTQFNRKFELSAFKIRYDGLIHTAIFQRIKKKLKFSSKASELSDISIAKSYQERHKMISQGKFVDTFNDELTRTEIKQNYLLDGYFQSERYFDAIHPIIRQDFEFKSKFQDTSDILSRIKEAENSVCIGVRRYNESQAAAVHCKLDMDYYKEAIKRIYSLISPVRFFVFSLDQDWAKENLRLPEACFVEPSKEPAADLFLMKHCKHFIIPNSTYFWWGAWLSENINKIVIAPKNGWCNEFTIQDNWIKI